MLNYNLIVSEADERHFYKEIDIKETIRKYVVEMLDKGEISGYLAFDDGMSIGWCNAAVIDSYEGFVPEFARENRSSTVGVCVLF